MRLIDADALKELFREVIGRIAKKPEMNGNLEHMIRASAMVIQMIDDAPTVQPERKTGRWIYGESEVGNDGYYCSECGNFVPWIYEESAMNFIMEYKFCPNCGADMRPTERRTDG